MLYADRNWVVSADFCWELGISHHRFSSINFVIIQERFYILVTCSACSTTHTTHWVHLVNHCANFVLIPSTLHGQNYVDTPFN
uniref:Uncharacterized protein n=1 Tax=Anguilla anguilla TaxID=7936 RepID=A0A0E9UDG5_ANGAN